MKSLAPLIIFAYNRPDHLRKCIESVLINPLAGETDLHIFSDGPKKEGDLEKINEIRAYIKNIKNFKQIFTYEAEKNKGLAKSVIEGVSNVLLKYGKAIVVEDDLICSSNFLNFMNEALDFYRTNPLIFSISGYTYPIQIPSDYTKEVFLLPRASSYGWATWQDRWEKADWDIEDFETFKKNPSLQKEFAEGGEDLVPMLLKQKLGLVDSWAVRWSYAHYKHNSYCLYSIDSRINDMGGDASGTHVKKTEKLKTKLSDKSFHLTNEVQPNKEIIKNLQSFFKLSLIRKTINYFKLK